MLASNKEVMKLIVNNKVIVDKRIALFRFIRTSTESIFSLILFTKFQNEIEALQIPHFCGIVLNVDPISKASKTLNKI